MAPPKIEIKLTRRDFLKASAIAAMFAALDWNRVINAFADAVRNGDIGIVWLEAQDCAGNTTSIIQATNPSLLDVLLGRTPLVGPGTVRLIFHETVMLEWGATHVTSFSQTEQPRYIGLRNSTPVRLIKYSMTSPRVSTAHTSSS